MKKTACMFAAILFVTPAAFAETEGAVSGSDSGTETTAAVIDTAEGTGKSAAGSAIDQTASAVGGAAGSEVAATGKSMANDKIGETADSARARYGVGGDAAKESAETAESEASK